MNIPNFEDIPFIIKQGDQFHLSNEWRNILQQLFQELQKNASNEGLVAPTQDQTNLIKIQNNLNQNGTNSCQFGTILYDSTNNSIRIAIDNGSGAPIFKTVTLT